MIFVTGGTGLIGSHLLYALIVSGKKVRALKRETSNLNSVVNTFSYYSKNAEELFKKIEWVDGDILDYYRIEELLKGVSVVYHCAAIVSFHSRQRRKMISNNVRGTANMVNAAIENNVEKFCHVSSVAALGTNINGEPTDEKTIWIPSKKNSGYSDSKFFSETEVWRGIEEGLNAVIVNPSVVLGPGNWKSGSSQLFSSVYNGLKFYTKGGTGFVGVYDVVKAMIFLTEKGNFNICKNQRFLLNSENKKYKELFEDIAEALEKEKPRYVAHNFMLQIAWRAVWVYNLFVKNKVSVTRETTASANRMSNYNGEKITKYGFYYSPIIETIRKTSTILKNIAKSEKQVRVYVHEKPSSELRLD